MSSPSPRSRTPGKRSGKAPAGPSADARPQLARAPRQERGQRRVDAILDAAAEILVEEGSGGVTMHRVAKRSRTTTGSMYHFFPDRDALLRALANRHIDQMRELLARIERDEAPEWASGSTPEAVDGFLGPVLSYVDQHPSLPAISRFAQTAGWGGRRDEKLDELFVRLGRSLVLSRCSPGSEQELSVRSVAVVGMMEGILRAGEYVGAGARSEVSRTSLRVELRNALIAYLDSTPTESAQGLR
ncbi:MAG TPA: TetR family transcriptional regulator [Gemmatimonadales bacterium]|nr:TetR family transcriptional regulator [Gemmatimonadales bacterium]